MTGTSTTCLYLGTRGGLYRWQARAISPLSSESDAITALGTLPAGHVLAATATGRLLRIDPVGKVVEVASMPGSARVTSLLTVAGPSVGLTTVLALSESGVLFESGDLGVTFRRSREDWLLQAIPHPIETELWLARSADQMLRSNDGARTFKAARGWPSSLRPRLVHYGPPPRAVALAVAWPAAVPPDPSDPSPLWESRDTGQTFHPIPSRLIDRVRDPSGELCAISSWRDGDSDLVALGTDRGELLEWRLGERPATLLADGLPPIESLLALPHRSALDPSSSGIHLLP